MICKKNLINLIETKNRVVLKPNDYPAIGIKRDFLNKLDKIGLS